MTKTYTEDFNINSDQLIEKKFEYWVVVVAELFWS